VVAVSPGGVVECVEAAAHGSRRGGAFGGDTHTPDALIDGNENI
jgi:hypothetical protein